MAYGDLHSFGNPIVIHHLDCYPEAFRLACYRSIWQHFILEATALIATMNSFWPF